MGISVGMSWKWGGEVRRNLQIWTSSTTFPAPPPPGHAVPTSVTVWRPRSMRRSWACGRKAAPALPALLTAGSLWGLYLGAVGPPRTLVWQEDYGMEKLACSTDTWNPDVAPVRAMHSDLSYSARGLLPTLTQCPPCRGLLLWQELSRAPPCEVTDRPDLPSFLNCPK